VAPFAVDVIDPLTLNPLDMDRVLTSVAKTGRVVIVHEAVLTCGLGAEIAATIAAEGIFHLRGPVIRVAAPDVTMPLPRLTEQYLPTEARIAKAVNEVMRY
jgi:pyruvate dehydrogenase E1 component beta subunit